MKGHLFIISGPSGVGKDTIANGLIKKLKIKKLPTFTTRKPRKGEKEGRQYYFVSKAEFKDLIKKGEILEYNYYNQNYYGTCKKDIERALKTGQNVLLSIDVHGGLNIKKLYPNAYLIFLKSKLSDIKSRLEKRGENTEKEIEQRLQTAEKEMGYEKYYDFTIENPEGYPEKAIKEAEKIIKNNKRGNSDKKATIV